MDDTGKSKAQLLEELISLRKRLKRLEPGTGQSVSDGEQGFRSLFESLGDFLVILDDKGCIQYVNRLVTERLGFSAEELAGKSILVLRAPDQQTEVLEILTDILNGKRDSCPLPVVAKNGELVPVETRVARGSWNGKPALIGVARDLGERMQAERQREEAHAAAQSTRDNLEQLLRATAAIQKATTEREVLEVVAQAVHETGWESVGAHLFKDWEFVDSVYIGLDAEETALLESIRPNPQQRAEMFGPRYEEYKIGKSYFIPTEDKLKLQPDRPTRKSRRIKREGDTWDCWDVARVPMYDPAGRVIGVVAMDDPLSGQRPDKTTFQHLEFFADLAAATVSKLRLWADRNKAEYALRDSQERVRALSDASFEAIFLSERGVCIDQNLTAEKMFGHTAEEAIGQPGTEWIAPEDREMVMNNMLAGREEPYEATALRKDGTTFPCEIQARMLEYQGRLVRVTSLRDITARKEAEEALRESEEKWRSLVKNAPNMILIIDREGVIQFINYTTPQSTPEEVMGTVWHEFVPSSHHDTVRDQLKRVFDLHKRVDFEIPVQSPDGAMIWYRAHVGPIMSGDHVEAATAVIADVTQTKHLRELQSRAQKLETAGRIAGQVAHDFNNLLGPLVAYPDLIRGELPEGHPILPLVDDMQHTAVQMAEINQQLLTLGRRGHYTQEPIQLNDAVSDALRGLPELPKGVFCDVLLANDLMNICGGRSQICRAIASLLQNALEAMGGIGRLTVQTENCYVDDTTTVYARIPKGEYVRLTVSDTGGGIPPENLDRIFDPFFTTKVSSKRRGSGLGLSVVDGVTKDHGGYIDVTTSVGIGTSLCLYFPIVRDSVVVPKTDQIAGGTESVLIIDDDSIQREVSLRILKKLGYMATAVESGEEAIEFLRSDEQDLLVLDMVMPGGIDGAETYRQIHAFAPGQKAIIVSGYSETERVKEAQELGAGAFVRKPLTLDGLARVVRAELDRKRSSNRG